MTESGPSSSPGQQAHRYVAEKDTKSFMVVDGQPGPEYDGIEGGPTFQPDGSIEYLASRSGILYRVKQ